MERGLKKGRTQELVEIEYENDDLWFPCKKPEVVVGTVWGMKTEGVWDWFDRMKESMGGSNQEVCMGRHHNCMKELSDLKEDRHVQQDGKQGECIHHEL